MKFRKEERKEGKKEKRKKGRKEGKKEGRKIGRKEDRKEGRKYDIFCLLFFSLSIMNKSRLQFFLFILFRTYFESILYLSS